MSKETSPASAIDVNGQPSVNWTLSQMRLDAAVPDASRKREAMETLDSILERNLGFVTAAVIERRVMGTSVQEVEDARAVALLAASHGEMLNLFRRNYSYEGSSIHLTVIPDVHKAITLLGEVGAKWRMPSQARRGAILSWRRPTDLDRQSALVGCLNVILNLVGGLPASLDTEEPETVGFTEESKAPSP